MPVGQVIRSHSHTHYVLVAGTVVECHPRGRFRLNRQQVLAGDRVEVALTGPGLGRIDRVLPRTNMLTRPPIANVDQVIIIYTLVEPPADLRFLDRVLVHAEQAGLRVLIVLNKTDLLAPAAGREFKNQYERVGYRVLLTSLVTGVGLDELRLALAGQTSVLAGQSGVGKSRLAGALVPGHAAAVGTLSRRQGRGRHTTRHVELLPLADGGLLADTPGFTHATLTDLPLISLGTLFVEFARERNGCRFDDCLHRAEPDCAIKAAVTAGEILGSRYEHYLEFLAELEAARKW